MPDQPLFPFDDPRFDDARTRPLPADPPPVPLVPVPFVDDTPTLPSRVRRQGARATSTATAAGRPPTRGARTRGVSRRALLAAGAGVVGLGAVGAGLGYYFTHRQQSAPDVFASDAGQIDHLLRRAGFGPSPGDVGDYLSGGVQGAIDRLINYSAISDDLDARLSQLDLDFTKPQDLIRWFLLRMIYSQRPLEEKMTLFWSGVLTSSLRKIGGSAHFAYLINQNNLLRSHAIGKLDDLIHAISIDPAMLWWLDGRTSTGAQPNENYSRELMELFTLGIADASGNPNYTQNDVHNGALALAGWVVEQDGSVVLRPRRQYRGTVTYLGHTGNLGLDDVVTILCAHPATPRHLAWRMWNFFVYVTNLADPALQPMVDAYNQNDHSIGAMVRAMLTSPAFFSARAYRGKVKSPPEFLAGAARGLGLQVNGEGLPRFLETLGQVPFDPPNVAGWPGDQDSANWMSTQAWMSRVNFINLAAAAATGTYAAVGQYVTGADAPASSAVQQVIDSRGIASAQALLDYFVAALLDNDLNVDRRAVLSQALSQAPSGGAQLTLAGGGSVPAAGVRHMLYLLMSMPEYHLN